MPLLPNINVGTTANDGTGDDLRTAFTTVNENFQYIEAFFPNTSNIGLTANIDSTGVSTFNNVTINNVTSAVTFTSTIAVSGNISANNLSVTNGVTAATVSAATIGNSGATLTGTLSTAAQTNVTSLGTLTGLTLSGTLTGTTVNATTIGNTDSVIVGDSVSASTIGNSDSGVLQGTISTAAQPNITSVGTLSNLNVSGNVSVGNIATTTGILIGNVAQLIYTVFDDLGTARNTSANLLFYTNSPAITAFTIDGNLSFTQPTWIAPGVTRKVFLNNESGSTQYALLWNSKNNLGTNTVTISNGTVATLEFVAIDGTAANIFQTISNT